MAKTQVITNKPGARRRAEAAANAERNAQFQSSCRFGGHKLRIYNRCGAKVFEVRHKDGRRVKVLYSYYAARIFVDLPEEKQRWDMLKRKDRSK